MKRLHYIQKSVVLWKHEQPTNLMHPQNNHIFMWRNPIGLPCCLLGLWKVQWKEGKNIKYPPHRRRMRTLSKALSAIHHNLSIVRLLHHSEEQGLLRLLHGVEFWELGRKNEQKPPNLSTIASTLFRAWVFSAPIFWRFTPTKKGKGNWFWVISVFWVPCRLLSRWPRRRPRLPV